MNIRELHNDFKNKKYTVEEFINEIFNNIENNDYNTYITLNKEDALEKARSLDEKLANGEEITNLFGVPLAVKDNILTEGLRSTAASKSLKDFVPIYDADIIEKLKNTDVIIVGKTNMDEYAMGSSSETSYFGPTVNPFDTSLTPGGSSSGSAAALAAKEAMISLGTDTGGSVRNPADFCHVVGFAPSYGAISRHGVISMSNSLDRVGVLANNVADVRVLFDEIRGISDKDFTTIDIESYDKTEDISKLKIASFELKPEYELDDYIQEKFNVTKDLLIKNGANIETVTINHMEFINQVYTTFMSVEVESNIAKVDGLRYGQAVENYSSTEDFYITNRTENFGEEVQRRIALGNFFASKDFDQKYYKQALQIRYLVKEQMDKLLEEYDVIITPTTTRLPKKVGESSVDSNASFDSGMFNILTNLSNLPAISIPMNDDELGSIQIIGKRNNDLRLLEIAEKIEGLL